MLCRACGMESRNTKVCEFCNRGMQGAQGTGNREQGTGRPAAPTLNAPVLHAPALNTPAAPTLNGTPLAVSPPNAAPGLNAPAAALGGAEPTTLINAAPAPLNAPAPTARIQRTTLTGEVIDVPTSGEAAPLNAPGMFPAPNPNATTVMTAGGQYTGAAYGAMNAAGVSYGKMAPQMLRDGAGMPSGSVGEKWELFLAIASPILLLSAWTVHLMPHLVMYIGFANMFVLSLVLGATGAVPSYDESYFDVTVMLVVTFLFGPIIALFVYLITAAIKQECNGAVVGLLALQILVFQGMTLAFVSNDTAMKHIGMFALFGLMQFFGVCVGFLGWVLSSFFRPVGE